MLARTASGELPARVHAVVPNITPRQSTATHGMDGSGQPSELLLQQVGGAGTRGEAS
jgi:hypothetical protein